MSNLQTEFNTGGKSTFHRLLGGRGFTLIELLLVIAVMGVLAAVVLPRFNVGMSGAKVRLAARTYMQAARYARTMALLYQIETDLVVKPNGLIRVEAGPAAGEARGPYVPPGEAAPADASHDAVAAAPSAPDMKGGAEFAEDPSAAVTAAQLAAEGDVAEDVRVEMTLEGVTLTFLGFSDQEPAAAVVDATPEAAEDFRIRFRSNGTCRPHRVRIADGETMTLEVAMDMLGSAEIEGDEK